MDVFQEYGNDLVVTLQGDLQTVDATELSNQRIIRRLLTTPISVAPSPDYIDNPTYGAGLPQFIGQLNSPDNFDKIKRLIISQMLLEQSVSQNPLPDVELSGLPSQLNGTITYTNILTNKQIVATFSIP
jgi:hypothetical protein